MIYQLLLATLLIAYTPTQPLEKIPAPAVAAPDIIYRSSDLGSSWKSVSDGLPEDTRVMYLKSQGENLLIATENYGIYTGNSLANRWSSVGYLPFVSNERITGLYAEGTELYASLFGNGFFKIVDLGNVWIPWLPMDINLEDKSISAVLRSKDKLFVGASTGMFRTTDNGKTWKKVFDEGQVNTIVEQNGILYGGTFKGLIRSRDQGASWEWILKDGMVRNIVAMNDRVVVLSQYGEIRASTDSGQHWQRIDKGLPTSKGMADLVGLQGVLICSHKQGIYRSSDWGAHWELVRKSRENEQFLNLAVAGEVVYFYKTFGC